MRLKKTDSEALRNRAYELYMNTGMSYSEIAAAVGVGKDTVGDWAKRYNWQQSKAANSMTKEKNISMLLVHMNNLLEEINKREKGKQYATPAESDQILKWTKTIDQLSGRTSLPDYFNVITEFLKYLNGTNPESAKNIADLSKEFLQIKTRELEK
jgi:transposase